MGVVAIIPATWIAVYKSSVFADPLILWLSIILVCFCFIWSMVGFQSWLKNRKQKHEEYEYGINLRGLIVDYDLTNEDHAVRIGVIWDNVSQKPVRFHVEDFRVVINDITVTNPNIVSKSNIIPRFSHKTYTYPPLKKSILNEKTSKGFLEYTIKYGHPDFPPVRILKHKVMIFLAVRDGSVIHDHLIEEESDREISQ